MFIRVTEYVHLISKKSEQQKSFQLLLLLPFLTPLGVKCSITFSYRMPTSQ